MSGWGGEVIGHRGAAGLAPENTLPAFEAALAAGVDRVELDVRLSADGVPVVFHDYSLDRVLGAEQGSLRAVSKTPLAELRELDVGLALGDVSADIPTLRELLDALAGRTTFNVEAKASGGHGLLVMDACIEEIRRAKLEDETLLSSFHPRVVDRARQRAPEIPRALIVGEGLKDDPVAVAQGLRAEALHLPHERTDEEQVRRCHDAGLKVRPWTVDERDDMRRLMDLGVDGIITDRPDVLREVMAE